MKGSIGLILWLSDSSLQLFGNSGLTKKMNWWIYFMQLQIVMAGSSQPGLKIWYDLSRCNNQGADMGKSCFVAN
jgi:hypothetical protein